MSSDRRKTNDRRETAGRRKAFDPSDPTSMEVAMYDTAFAVRFLSQSFLGRTDMESVDSAGFEGLGIILECIADRIEAMEAAYAEMTGARTPGGRNGAGSPPETSGSDPAGGEGGDGEDLA